MKNRILLTIVLLGAFVGSLRMMQALTRSNKIPVPSIGTPYTIGALLKLINTNNPNNNSNFLVPLNRSSVVMNASAWAVEANGKISNITGSASVGTAGLQNLIQGNKDMAVVLKTDPKLISHLLKDGRLNATMAPKYTKILLYFELQGYRIYINDPFPGKIVRTPTGIRSPAKNIINKWAV